MYSNFKEQAIEYVRQAVQEDNAGNYAKAYPLYMLALEYFKTHLKYERNPKIKEAITQKFIEYLRRAVEIQDVLDEGGSGPGPNGGDAAVAAKPKSKPKDGDDGGEDPEQSKLRAGLNSAIVREKPNVKWNDVTGLESAKQALQEAVILPVKFPQFFTSAKDTRTTEGNNATSDTESALYLHPSDSPGMMLVPVHFDGTGYRSWKSEVMQALSVKNKLGFIDGSCGKPDANSPLFRQWKMCDYMVTSWILNSMIKEISDSVESVGDSAELWKVLVDRYDQINGAKMYQIQKEINNLTQGYLDITVYYARMNELWEELSSLNLRSRCNCTCICGGKDSMHKAEQDRLLIQFLMGLNEEYSVMRGNILAMNPLPSVAQAFSLLIKEDEQKDPDSASASELNDGKVVDIHSVSELETKLNDASKVSRLAMLYFTATWCGSCRFVSPFYSSLPGKYPKVAFLKADIVEARDVASRWNVSSVPAFFFIKNGKEIDRVVVADKNSLEKKIAQYAG